MAAIELPSDGLSNRTSPKTSARDADILVLLWDLLRTRDSEIGHLVDLALCMLSSAPSFSNKADLQRSLEKVSSLLRNTG